MQAQRERLRESDVEADLKKIQVKAGAGKLKVWRRNGGGHFIGITSCPLVR